MDGTPVFGRGRRLTVAGATVLATGISSVGGAQLIGIMCHASVTGATTIQLWAGTTATGTAAGVALCGVLTFVSATATGTARLGQFIPFPGYASGGCAINIGGDASPDLTLYWNPA